MHSGTAFVGVIDSYALFMFRGGNLFSVMSFERIFLC